MGWRAGVCGRAGGGDAAEAGTVVVAGGVVRVGVLADSQDVMSRFEPAIGVGEESRVRGLMGGRMLWRPGMGWAVVMAVVFAACFLSLSNVTEFLYYQF